VSWTKGIYNYVYIPYQIGNQLELLIRSFPTIWSWISKNGRLWRKSHIFDAQNDMFSDFTLNHPSGGLRTCWQLVNQRRLGLYRPGNVHICSHRCGKPTICRTFSGKEWAFRLSTSFGMFTPGYPCKNPPRDSLTQTIGVVPCRHTGISGALRMPRQDAVPGDVANS
jgi:hypothetical protein